MSSTRVNGARPSGSTRSATDVPSAERLNQMTPHRLTPTTAWANSGNTAQVVGAHVTASAIVEDPKLVNMGTDHEWAILVVTKQFPQTLTC